MQHAAADGVKPPSFLSHLFSDRKIAPMLVLGFASGIPYQLVYITQSAWLYEAKVPIATIGLMSELTLAYKFKFLWAPFLDRYDAPVFSRLLGRRRGWIVVSQIGCDGGAGRGRSRRSGALACLDRGVFARARLRWSDSGRGDRWLAHQRRAGQTPSADGLMVGGRLSYRRPRRRSRRAPARGSGRMARRLSLHGCC